MKTLNLASICYELALFFTTLCTVVEISLQESERTESNPFPYLFSFMLMNQSSLSSA